jgi:hypothetical protein
MYIYKELAYYDTNTGKKAGTKKVVDKILCDFTGNELEDEEIEYEVNYNSIDPWCWM